MALSYIGGKSKIAAWIRDYIPKDIETFVEPFSGMFWVFFKLDLNHYPNLKKVVYNDVNPLNVNLFNCLKEPMKLWEVSKDIPIEDAELFLEYKSEVFDENLKLDKTEANFNIAYKYAYILSQVWSGTDPKKGKLIKNGGYVGKDGVYKSKFEIFRSKLPDPKWQKYFSLITNVECSDFEEVIKKYDSEKTFFYCDPPYYKTENYYINHDFGIDTHKRLADSLTSIKGRFALSYYFFDQLNEWYSQSKFRWEDKVFAKTAMAVSGKSQSVGTEMLIMNYGVKSETIEQTQDESGIDFDFSI
jgi:DNA adenine methylase